MFLQLRGVVAANAVGEQRSNPLLRKFPQAAVIDVTWFDRQLLQHLLYRRRTDAFHVDAANIKLLAFVDVDF